MRIAAVGDLHCTAASKGTLEPLLAAMRRDADALVLAGDLTDLGLPEEAHVLARELQAARPRPVVAVLGNHDYEAGAAD
jgi:3',5'-cyclic AMP phosphodiesterase CpdA